MQVQTILKNSDAKISTVERIRNPKVINQATNGEYNVNVKNVLNNIFLGHFTDQVMQYVEMKQESELKNKNIFRRELLNKTKLISDILEKSFTIDNSRSEDHNADIYALYTGECLYNVKIAKNLKDNYYWTFNNDYVYL
jgi:hypothetical protein